MSTDTIANYYSHSNEKLWQHCVSSFSKRNKYFRERNTTSHINSSEIYNYYQRYTKTLNKQTNTSFKEIFDIK